MYIYHIQLIKQCFIEASTKYWFISFSLLYKQGDDGSVGSPGDIGAPGMDGEKGPKGTSGLPVI